MNLRRALVYTLAISLLTGAGNLRSEPSSYLVGPGDVLQIAVYAGGERQEEFTATVSAAGTITCPLIGEYKLAGMAAPEIAGKMRQILARDYFVDPQVLVAVKEYAGKIYVLGEVKRPGLYPIREGLTVLSACDLAGGLTDFAVPRRVRITRVQDGKPRQIAVDLTKVRQGRSKDVVLQGGDRIEVPQRWF